MGEVAWAFLGGGGGLIAGLILGMVFKDKILSIFGKK